MQECTALMLAVEAKSAAVVKLLLDNHADLDVHGYGVRSPP